LICINVVVVIAGSFTEIAIKYAFVLKVFENISIGIFTVEYILRLWTARYKYPNVKYPYVRFIFSFMAIIDLMAILPFYIPFH
jgi:voltage-gated potassium channel